MKFSISLILLSISIVVFVKVNEAHYVGALIKGIHHKYATTGVTIALGPNYLSFEKITIWHETVRMLSNEGITTRIVNFRQFEDNLKVRSERTVRLLIVIVIDTIKELHTFESITKDSHISSVVWLLFFVRDASRDICDFCRNPHRGLSILTFRSKVLISCCDSHMIEEWWSIAGNRIKRQELGRLMDEDVGIVWISDELVYARRYSMDGRGLRIVMLEYSMAFWIKDGDYYGFIGELVKELSRALNFTVSEIIKEKQAGAWNPETSKWTGALGRVYRREVDMAVAAFTMTSDRYDRVSFSSPIAVGTWGLHFRKHDVAHLVWNAHFKALTVGVWMVIIGLILIAPILLMVIKYKRGPNFFSLLFQQYLYVWGIYCQQGLPEFPNELPSRIVYVTILLSAMVTSGAYSSALISSLATASYPSFNTIEQFVNDGTYKLIILQRQSLSQLYKFPDATLPNKLTSMLKPHDLRPRTIGEAFEQVCSERVAFFGDTWSMKVLAKIPCEITTIEAGETDNMAFILPKGNEYTHLINHYIALFRTNGILKRLENKYSAKSQPYELDLPLVDLQGIAPLLLILAVGFLIALIILIIERNVYPSTKNRGLLIRPPNWKRRITIKKRKRLPFSLHNYVTRKLVARGEGGHGTDFREYDRYEFQRLARRQTTIS